MDAKEFGCCGVVYGRHATAARRLTEWASARMRAGGPGRRHGAWKQLRVLAVGLLPCSLVHMAVALTHPCTALHLHRTIRVPYAGLRASF